ncbi:carboxypeptidase-like regulatory domain-containing protein, partial [Neptunitalea chrysea]|uniref:carboxypeptidase-like regulatory domain-containing protein n=1 Tax=Neptunitalea chrysea TaxID=1647581 RepID=UPI0024910FB6
MVQQRPLVCFFIFLCVNCLNAQNITVKGVIADAVKAGIVNVNVLAESEQEEGVKFAISDSDGKYSIKLKANTLYTVTVNHLGFKEIT